MTDAVPRITFRIEHAIVTVAIVLSPVTELSCRKVRHRTAPAEAIAGWHRRKLVQLGGRNDYRLRLGSGNQHQRTGYSIGEVVVLTLALRVIDAVAAGAAGAPFKTGKLVNETLVVEQADAAAGEQRQAIQMDFRAVQFGWFVGDVALFEGRYDQIGAIVVANYFSDVVATQELCDVLDDAVAVKRCSTLKQQIQDRDISLGMNDGHRKGIAAPTARISKGLVVNVWFGALDQDALIDRCRDQLPIEEVR